jgi:hypothetical protein
LTLNVQRVFTLTQKLVPMLEKGSKRDGVGRVINVSHQWVLKTTSERIDWVDKRSFCTWTGDICLFRI